MMPSMRSLTMRLLATYLALCVFETTAVPAIARRDASSSHSTTTSPPSTTGQVSSSVDPLSAVPASVTYASGAFANPTALSHVANPGKSNETLKSQLRDATLAVDRFKLLYNAGPEYWRFDFAPSANPDGGVAMGRGGQGILANRDTYPMLTGLGLAMSYGWMNPCGMNTPHTHPRGTEFLSIVTPTPNNPVRTGFIMENGMTMEFSTELRQYTATIFPMGSIHFEFNDNCEPALFVAAFSDEDPGLSSIAQNFFSLNASIIEADIGFAAELNQYNIAQLEPYIPPSFALGAKSCLDRCGIQY